MLGLRRALVVHGNDGLEEITISTTTRIAELRDGQVRTYEVSPEEFGLHGTANTIAGGMRHDCCDCRSSCAGKNPPAACGTTQPAAALVRRDMPIRCTMRFQWRGKLLFGCGAWRNLRRGQV